MGADGLSLARGGYVRSVPSQMQRSANMRQGLGVGLQDTHWPATRCPGRPAVPHGTHHAAHRRPSRQMRGRTEGRTSNALTCGDSHCTRPLGRRRGPSSPTGCTQSSALQHGGALKYGGDRRRLGHSGVLLPSRVGIEDSDGTRRKQRSGHGTFCVPNAPKDSPVRALPSPGYCWHWMLTADVIAFLHDAEQDSDIHPCYISGRPPPNGQGSVLSTARHSHICAPLLLYGLTHVDIIHLQVAWILQESLVTDRYSHKVQVN